MELKIEAANAGHGNLSAHWTLNQGTCEIVGTNYRGVESKVLVPKDALKSLANALKS